MMAAVEEMGKIGLSIPKKNSEMASEMSISMLEKRMSVLRDHCVKNLFWNHITQRVKNQNDRPEIKLIAGELKIPYSLSVGTRVAMRRLRTKNKILVNNFDLSYI